MSICLVVAICKLALFLADPYPSFHFGDSGAYLATALIKWIPPDRSFSYGFLLRPLVFGSHSLAPVLAVQILLSALASIVLGLVLSRYFCATPTIAVIFAGLSAIEPLQLMSERFVMTEAVATFGFAIYLALALSFMTWRRLATLAGVQLIGVLLVSLRYSFLPLVVFLSFALPVLAFYKLWRVEWKPFVVRLCIGVVACQLLLAGYRHLYGFLAHTKPAYLSRDGDFLVSDMAPIIRPEDFPIPADRNRLFQKIKIPLDDLFNRRLHRWVEGGVCQAILDIAKQDEDLANVLARRTALRAMKRDPIGVIRLGLGTYREFLTREKVVWGLELNEGHFGGPSASDIKLIGDWFHVDTMDRRYRSLTKRWHGASAPWCSLIVLLPWLYLLEMTWHKRRVSGLDWVVLLSGLCLLGSAIVPVEIANPRYLMPLPWLSVLILGIMVCRSPLTQRTGSKER